MFRHIISTLMFLVFPFVLQAATRLDSLAYQSYTMRVFSSWPGIIEAQQTQAKQEGVALDVVISPYISYYGYIGYLLDTKQKEEAARWLKKAVQSFDAVQQRYPDEAAIWALHSMFVSYEIALAPYKAAYRLSELFTSLDKAEMLDKDHYLVLLARANFMLYFPEALGGDKELALVHYKAIYSYFQDPAHAAYANWIYLNILSTISFTYEKLERYPEAIAWAQRALEVAPDFAFVKEELLPRLKSY